MGGVLGGIVGGVADIAGSIIGDASSSDERNAAKAAAEKAIKTIQETGAPPETAKEIFLKEFKSAGILTPEMEQNINVKFQPIVESKEGREAQMNALRQLQQISSGGLRPEDRFALSQIEQQTARENQAAQNDVIRNLAQRGQAGGGAELAARLQASQAGANQLSNQGLQVGALASQRALEALANTGSLAGNLRSQDYNAASRNADIANEMERFNIQNQLNVQQRNINARNAAQEKNLDVAQGLLNKNTDQTNQELLRQNQAKVADWQNKMTQNRLIADAYNQQSKLNQDEAAATQNKWSSIGKGVGGIAAGVGKYYNDQPKPVLNQDEEETTNKIKGYKLPWQE